MLIQKMFVPRSLNDAVVSKLEQIHTAKIQYLVKKRVGSALTERDPYGCGI